MACLSNAKKAKGWTQKKTEKGYQLKSWPRRKKQKTHPTGGVHSPKRPTLCHSLRQPARHVPSKTVPKHHPTGGFLFFCGIPNKLLSSGCGHSLEKNTSAVNRPSPQRLRKERPPKRSVSPSAPGQRFRDAKAMGTVKGAAEVQHRYLPDRERAPRLRCVMLRMCFVRRTVFFGAFSMEKCTEWALF